MITPGVTNVQNVLGQQAWTSWTPTFTAASGTFTTITVTEAKYLARGKDIEWVIDFTITDKGSAQFDIRFTMPTTIVQIETHIGINPTSATTTYQATSFGGTNQTWVLTHTNGDPIADGVRISIRGRYRAVA